MTVRELFYTTILSTYYHLLSQSEIKNPWPVTKRSLVDEILKADIQQYKTDSLIYDANSEKVNYFKLAKKTTNVGYLFSDPNESTAETEHRFAVAKF